MTGEEERKLINYQLKFLKIKKKSSSIAKVSFFSIGASSGERVSKVLNR